MLTIEKTVLPSPEQWEIIIEGMRNPMNSWARMDSYKTHIEDAETLQTADFEFFIGENDLKLMNSLAKGGPVHAKYRRMIPVFLTINAPLYWWKEFDTYKVGTTANSTSTMHTIHKKRFSIDDFSIENMTITGIAALRVVIDFLENQRFIFNETKDKAVWCDIISLLPSSYNQKRTVTMNYENLVNMYHARKNHKLDEWHTFCDWIKELPYSEIITGVKE